jgi:hypothetical protein
MEHQKKFGSILDQTKAEQPLEIGQMLSNGGVVLKFTWREYQGGEAKGKHGLVLCWLPNNYDPFVVWRFVKTYPDRVICETGDYCRTLDDAMKAFGKRHI